jgi:hypothetical protein
MVLVLHFRPRLLHRFSTKKIFPVASRRLLKTPDPQDDFSIDLERSSEFLPIDAATVLLAGHSLDQSLISQLPGPIYAVNWPNKLDREDVIYTSSDPRFMDRFSAKDMFPCLLIEINWFDTEGNYIARDAGSRAEEYLSDPRFKRVSLYHKSGPQSGGGMPATSGLAAVVGLSYLAKSVEVYGWDFYLDFSPAESGYWKSIFKAFVNLEMEIQPHHIEVSMYNWHYAHRFSELPNFKIQGRLSGLEKHRGINQRLDKVFYNA